MDHIIQFIFMQYGPYHTVHIYAAADTVFRARIFRQLKRDEVTGNGENYIMRSLVICTPYPILCGW
jgi:hypothetical protein